MIIFATVRICNHTSQCKLTKCVTAESDAYSELNPPDNYVFPGLHHFTCFRSVPSWCKDYIIRIDCY